MKNKETIIMYPPYYGITSLYLSKKIKKICTKYFKNININFACNTAKLKDFFRYMDILPHCLQTGVVYKFSCSGCNSTYVGITS